jgi:hypothetical protein
MLGNLHGKGSAGWLIIGNLNRTPVIRDDFFAEIQAQAGTLGSTHGFISYPVKSFENLQFF